MRGDSHRISLVFAGLERRCHVCAGRRSSWARHLPLCTGHLSHAISTDRRSLRPTSCCTSHDAVMASLPAFVARRGHIVRRADIVRAGFTDAHIRAALARGYLDRVRHGWYASRDVPEVVLRAVRVGGRMTGLAALRLHDLFLPKPAFVDLVVPRNAAGLRRPGNMKSRLRISDGIRVSWIDGARSNRPAADWRASDDDALLHVLTLESREVAVACCDAAIRYLGFDEDRIDRVFARAPTRVQRWRADVDGRADAWGETIVRLRAKDAGLPFIPQPHVPGVGRLDGQIAPRTFVEIDGRQHDEEWTGNTPSSFERDHERDVELASQGKRAIHLTYRQILNSWDRCLDALIRARQDDLDDLARAAHRRP
jgi:Transcriptional regulator, AbiEi antitoxin